MVEVVGAAAMAELTAALRHVSDEIGDVVLSELEEIAKGVAADAARQVPRRTGRAAASYRAAGAAVSYGGPDVPYVPWLEFGGKVGPGKGVTRPYIKGGRYLYPTLGRAFEDIESRVDELITAITHGYLEVE